MRPFLPMLLFATACECSDGRPPGDSPDDSTPRDTSPRDTTDSEPPPRDPLRGLVQTGWDTEEFADLGLIHGTWEMTAEHEGGYRTTEGADPRFHVMATPNAFTDGQARPVLLWLHGGVAGVVGDPTEDGIPCTQEQVDILAENAISGHPFLLATVAAREWILVIPESTWCDLWAGLGPDDPVNPVHTSLVHIDWTLAALEAGLEGLVPDRAHYTTWGTSIGGIGVWPVSRGIDGWGRTFAGAISDSGPVILPNWYSNEWGGKVLDANMGGPAFVDGVPTEYHPNYQRVDARMLVEDIGFRTPMFVAYNAHDNLCPPTHGETMRTVFGDTYGEEGARYFIHDWDHHGPGERGHTQTANDEPPYFYTVEAAASFLAGQTVAFVEAEDTCLDCTIDAEEPDGDWTAWPARYSGGAAARRLASEGPGRLYLGQMPEDLPRDVPLTLLLVVDAANLEACAEDQQIARVHLGADGVDLGDLTLFSGDFAGLEGSALDARAQLARTTLLVVEDLDGDGDADGLPSGVDVALTISTEGCGDLWFDGYWATW